MVDAVRGRARPGARARATEARARTRSRKQLTALADQLETPRKTLVATREGGAIAGEEQLREKLGNLYGAVNGYDGRPTNTQIDYAEVLSAELESTRVEFEALMRKELEPINRSLAGLKLDPIRVLTREDWAKRQVKG